VRLLLSVDCPVSFEGVSMKTKGITTGTVISQVEEIVVSDIDGETVVMSVENGKYCGLDDIGSRIWELIERPVKVSTLIDTLLENLMLPARGMI